MKYDALAAVCTLLLVLDAQVASATPIPGRDIATLVRNADVIVVGRVVGVMDSGPTSVRVGDRDNPARDMVGDLEIDTVVKGPALQSLRFRFTAPEAHLGYRDTGSGEYRMFLFVTNTDGHYEFASPYDPSLVAVPGTHLTMREPLERVIQIAAAVAIAPRASSMTKVEAIAVLWDVKHPAALTALRATLKEHDERVRLSAAAGLIAEDDVTALPIAEEALLRPLAGIHYGSELLDNLQVAISEGLKDEAAVPALSRMLDAPNRGVRQAAVSGLRHTRAPSAIQPLARALDDGDQEIRHIAVSGLAEIARRPDLNPGRAEFLSDPERYIAFWKDWAARQE